MDNKSMGNRITGYKITSSFLSQKLTREAPNIAMDLGLSYIRNLDRDEIRQMAVNAAQGNPLTLELKSFRSADFIIEAADGDQICYILIEASCTLDHRDTDRAIHSAALLTQFTGKPAKPAILGIRVDDEIKPLIESGQVFWYEIEAPR